MEQDASAFAAAVEEATDTVPTQAIQQLKGRFRFLWGMYKAHSEVPPLSHCSSCGIKMNNTAGVRKFEQIDTFMMVESKRVCTAGLPRAHSAPRVCLSLHPRQRFKETLHASITATFEPEVHGSLGLGWCGKDNILHSGYTVVTITGAFDDAGQEC